MRIGVLGAGLMGSKLGTILARAGHDVVFSYSHSREKLEQLARDAGPYNGTGNTHGGSRFDYVFHSRVTALALQSVNVPDMRVNGIESSDHAPVGRRSGLIESLEGRGSSCSIDAADSG